MEAKAPEAVCSGDVSEKAASAAATAPTMMRVLHTFMPGRLTPCERVVPTLW